MSKSKCLACQSEIDNHSILICEDCIGDNCNVFLNYITQYDESILDIENMTQEPEAEKESSIFAPLSEERKAFILNILENGKPEGYTLTPKDWVDMHLLSDPDPWLDEPWTEEEMKCFENLDEDSH